MKVSLSNTETGQAESGRLEENTWPEMNSYFTITGKPPDTPGGASPSAGQEPPLSIVGGK